MANFINWYWPLQAELKFEYCDLYSECLNNWGDFRHPIFEKVSPDVLGRYMDHHKNPSLKVFRHFTTRRGRNNIKVDIKKAKRPPFHHKENIGNDLDVFIYF